jgi:hypothetical protein
MIKEVEMYPTRITLISTTINPTPGIRNGLCFDSLNKPGNNFSMSSGKMLSTKVNRTVTLHTVIAIGARIISPCRKY